MCLEIKTTLTGKNKLNFHFLRFFALSRIIGESRLYMKIKRRGENGVNLIFTFLSIFYAQNQLYAKVMKCLIKSDVRTNCQWKRREIRQYWIIHDHHEGRKKESEERSTHVEKLFQRRIHFFFQISTWSGLGGCMLFSTCALDTAAFSTPASANDTFSALWRREKYSIKSINISLLPEIKVEIKVIIITNSHRRWLSYAFSNLHIIIHLRNFKCLRSHSCHAKLQFV